jgi:hypothetical protein
MDLGLLAFVFAVAIALAVGGTLLLVGYIGTLPAALAFGWRDWLPTLAVPIAGPIWFAWRHWAEFSRPGKQLMIGVLLVAIALIALYVGGPHMVDRMAPPPPA